MKILKKCAFAIALSSMMISCVGNASQDLTSGVAATSDAACALKIAYVHQDSIMQNYNLAKDVTEAIVRNSNKLETAQRQKSTEVQNFAAEMQRKYESNGYLSESSFNADQKKLQKMQVDAETYLVNLQRTIQNDLQQSNIELNDSIEKFMNEYAKSNGYDVILQKAAAFYIGSGYDVTSDVVTKLNARYNKVSGK
ncbi:MAG: OmpH family outer membrane protein [Bacteroidales bacterium]